MKMGFLMTMIQLSKFSVLMRQDTLLIQTNTLFFKKPSKDSYLLTPTCGKAMYTVLACGSASSEYLPPLVVYDNICMGHGVRMDQKSQGTVAHQVDE